MGRLKKLNGGKIDLRQRIDEINRKKEKWNKHQTSVIGRILISLSTCLGVCIGVCLTIFSFSVSNINNIAKWPACLFFLFLIIGGGIAIINNTFRQKHGEYQRIELPKKTKTFLEQELSHPHLVYHDNQYGDIAITEHAIIYLDDYSYLKYSDISWIYISATKNSTIASVAVVLAGGFPNNEVRAILTIITKDRRIDLMDYKSYIFHDIHGYIKKSREFSTVCEKIIKNCPKTTLKGYSETNKKIYYSMIGKEYTPLPPPQKQYYESDFYDDEDSLD